MKSHVKTAELKKIIKSDFLSDFLYQYFSGPADSGITLHIEIRSELQFIRRWGEALEKFDQIIQKRPPEKDRREEIKITGCNVQPETVQRAVFLPFHEDIVRAERPVITARFMQFCDQWHVERKKIFPGLCVCCCQRSSILITFRETGHDPRVLQNRTALDFAARQKLYQRNIERVPEDPVVDHLPQSGRLNKHVAELFVRATCFVRNRRAVRQVQTVHFFPPGRPDNFTVFFGIAPEIIENFQHGGIGPRPGTEFFVPELTFCVDHCFDDFQHTRLTSSG